MWLYVFVWCQACLWVCSCMWFLCQCGDVLVVVLEWRSIVFFCWFFFFWWIMGPQMNPSLHCFPQLLPCFPHVLFLLLVWASLYFFCPVTFQGRTFNYTINIFCQCVSIQRQHLFFASSFIGICLNYFMSSTLGTLSYHFSPGLRRHHLRMSIVY